jgi:hypothetical protein
MYVTKLMLLIVILVKTKLALSNNQCPTLYATQSFLFYSFQPTNGQPLGLNALRTNLKKEWILPKIITETN